MSNECLAEFAGVKKRFGSVTALDGFDLQVKPGELLALLGPNGAGKSTAISLLLGLRQPDSGIARLFGRPPLEIESRRRIGVMMQEVALAPELRVREHIELIASYYPDPMPAGRSSREDEYAFAGEPSLRQAFCWAEAPGAICIGVVRKSVVVVSGRADGGARYLGARTRCGQRCAN